MAKKTENQNKNLIPITDEDQNKNATEERVLQDYKNAMEEVKNLPIDTEMRPLEKTLLNDTTVAQIIDLYSVVCGVPTHIAIVAMMYLFLAGAANKDTPITKSITIPIGEGQKQTFKKLDLVYAYEKITDNKFLRRLAETLRNQISEFAEKHSLQGDLAKTINTSLIAEGQNPLTPKQAAWCSSFNTYNPRLNTETDLIYVAQLLAKDYNKRFEKIKQGKNKTKNTSTKSSPRKNKKTQKPKTTNNTNKKEKNN